ncbi:virginiamycin B lyase family protein [Spirillospora sp. CA-142024]|uniref:Vgb family protein n=1 Tax=Spirillospora sp. CA-142024 TaxID=3240036 RepID=UPI003D91D718
MRHRRSRALSLAAALALGAGALTAVPGAAAAASPVREIALPVPDVLPLGLAAGSDGSVWYAANAGGIGRVDAAGKVTEYPVAENSKKLLGAPDAMTSAPDGSLWFTDVSTAAPRVGRVDPATGKSTLYELPTTGTVNFANAQVSDITPGPDGALWFTGGVSGSIGRIDASGTVTAYATRLFPYALTTGPDKAIWFTTGQGVLGRLDPATGAVTTFPTPSAGKGTPAMGGIVIGPDGKLWFTEPGAGRVGRIDPATHAVDEYSTPVPDSMPTGIVTGPDRKLWITETAASNIASVDPVSGAISEYPLPATLSAPQRIVNGPGGHLWFSEPGRGLIGHLDPAAPPAGTRHPAVPALLPGAAPNGAAQFMNQCPREQLCQTQVTTGGSVEIGSFQQELPAGAIRITGYLGEPDETGDLVLKPPVAGRQLVSTPVEVPGGLIGQLPLIGPILGKTPAAMWDVNRLTVTQSLAGPIHVSLSGGGLGAKASLNVHLNNQLLGATCVIGPIEANLAPAFRTGDLAFDPLLSWLSGQIAISAPVAVPAAKGCGPFGILDGVINQMMGLPSPASENTMNLTGVLSLASGINPSNTPQAAAPAEAAKLLKDARTVRKPRVLPAAPKKKTVRVTPR